MTRAVFIETAETVPLAKTERIVIVGGGDGGGGGIGPSRLSRDVERVIVEVPETVKALTGLDIIAASENVMREKVFILCTMLHQTLLQPS